MNKQESAKLLCLVELSYPNCYKHFDDTMRLALVNMWASTFSVTPYCIVEQAFNHHRMVSKYPPTIAEIIAELRGIYYEAETKMWINKTLENQESIWKCKEIMNYTEMFTRIENVVILDINNITNKMEDGCGVSRLHEGSD